MGDNVTVPLTEFPGAARVREVPPDDNVALKGNIAVNEIVAVAVCAGTLESVT